MTYKATAAHLLTFTVLFAGNALSQHGKDELNYSASMCTPPTANQFQGSGEEGLYWDSKGIWLNRDPSESQKLICSIPFDQNTIRADGTFGIIEIRVNIFDNSHLHSIEAKLFATTGLGDPFSPRNPITTAFTSDSFTGASTLLLSATPPNDTRYLWIEIVLPREIWPAKRSGVIGYRINRIGF